MKHKKKWIGNKFILWVWEVYTYDACPIAASATLAEGMVFMTSGNASLCATEATQGITFITFLPSLFTKFGSNPLTLT